MMRRKNAPYLEVGISGQPTIDITGLQRNARQDQGVTIESVENNKPERRGAMRKNRSSHQDEGCKSKHNEWTSNIRRSYWDRRNQSAITGDLRGGAMDRTANWGQLVF